MVEMEDDGVEGLEVNVIESLVLFVLYFILFSSLT